MNQLQIESLRDIAISHLPRAEADREQARRFGSTHADFYRALAVTSVSMRSKSATTACEYAAANVLETICLLCGELETPLSKTVRTTLLEKLVRDAKELCTLTGDVVTWLDSLPALPPAAQEEEAPAPATAQATTSIAGRFLSTREAAQELGVAEQTLRRWASEESGPIRPSAKVGGTLRWSGEEILKLLKQR